MVTHGLRLPAVVVSQKFAHSSSVMSCKSMVVLLQLRTLDEWAQFMEPLFRWHSWTYFGGRCLRGESSGRYRESIFNRASGGSATSRNKISCTSSMIVVDHDSVAVVVLVLENHVLVLVQQ